MPLAQEEIVKTLLSSRMRVLASLWVIVRDAPAAEDIFQNVTVKALAGETRFAREAELISWAHVTARNEALNWVRAKRSQAVALDTAVLEMLEREWARDSAHGGADRVEALRDCLAALPAASRRVLELRYFDERSCAHVARESGVGIDAIYQRLSRLHRALKKCIERRLAGESARVEMEAS
ncbi:MAG: sigma-70 family RNA polymerase sigma factor [Planctomycetota bacterium]